MSEPSYFKGACQHCRGHIEFPPNALGTRVSCPHCGQQTELRDPANAPSLKAGCQTCGGRIAFPAEAAGSVVNCPHCGGKTELIVVASVAPVSRLKRRAWMIAGASAAAVGLLARLFVVFGKLERGNGEEVELNRFELRPANGGEPACVAGKIINHTSARFYSVKVEFDLFDKDGKPAGSAAEYLAILEPQDTWDFKAVVSHSDVVTVKLAKLAKEK